MKRTILFTLLIVSANLIAQTPKSIKLNKGQKINAKMSMSMDMDLGMGTMKTENNSEYNLQVIDENPSAYILTFTTTKMKMSVDGMGQSMTYDSEKPEDRNTEIGQTASAKLNVSDTLMLNKTTGEVKPLNEKSSEEKTSGGMFAMTNNPNQGAIDAFLIIPANIKVGGAWTDSIMAKGLTTKKTFKWISTDKNMATINVSGSMTGTIDQEMQGMSVTMGLDMTFNETRTVNITTGQVLKVTNDADMKNTMESMGMTMSSKIITTTDYSN